MLLNCIENIENSTLFLLQRSNSQTSFFLAYQCIKLTLLPLCKLSKEMCKVTVLRVCRRGARGQSQPEWSYRAGGWDAVRPHPCTLHPDKPRHRTDGRCQLHQQKFTLEAVFLLPFFFSFFFDKLKQCTFVTVKLMLDILEIRVL